MRKGYYASEFWFTTGFLPSTPSTWQEINSCGGRGACKAFFEEPGEIVACPSGPCESNAPLEEWGSIRRCRFSWRCGPERYDGQRCAAQGRCGGAHRLLSTGRWSAKDANCWSLDGGALLPTLRRRARGEPRSAQPLDGGTGSGRSACADGEQPPQPVEGLPASPPRHRHPLSGQLPELVRTSSASPPAPMTIGPVSPPAVTR